VAEKDETKPRLKEWFWFIRGSLSAITIVGLIPTLFDFSRFEFLRFIHAVIVGWNQVANCIGKLIGQLPYIPEIPNRTVHLVILISIFLSAAISVNYERQFRGHKDNRKTQKLLLPIMKVMRWSLKNKKKLILIFIALVFLDFLIFIITGINPFIAKTMANMAILLCVFLTGLAIYISKSFRSGVITLMGLLLTIEALYYLNLPVISDNIENFSDMVLGD